jgi:hypothetical protein
LHVPTFSWPVGFHLHCCAAAITIIRICVRQNSSLLLHFH